ncbi:MAG: hypothetical protein EOP48_34350 [Sphingobacteriales bacterium]|nr:MAG: hypothetical protein EOP48_34350 [Sphingobacteriales bacterium]
MKKKLLFINIMLIGLTHNVRAQSVIDTLSVLQTVVANKANYIGQPFSVLSSQLPISIKYFLPIPSSNKRHKELHTSFAFFYSQNVNRMYPTLEIYWQQPLNQLLSFNLWRQTSGAWTSIHSTHYANGIIADIGVIQ